MNMPEVNFTSIGKLSVDLQMPDARLRKLIAQAGLRPALVLNGIEYFDLTAIDKLYSARRRLPRNSHSIAEM